MKSSATALFAICCMVSSLCAEKTPVDHIRVVAVDYTPEPETATLTIQIPHQNDVVRRNPVWVQVKVEGYTLGSDSQFDRADELVNSDLGQTLHVVVDNLPFFAINGPSIDPFNEEGFYYDQNYKFQVPYQLNDGFHTLRVFPARSFGESLKGERTFQAIVFYVGEMSGDSDVLMRPYLTYNEPSDEERLVAGKPVLLDFLLSNCELSQDGYKVRLTIDGKVQRVFYVWKPYYIYGLKQGKHTVRLELIDTQNKLVRGPYNDVQRTITVH